jgi:threonine dehydratase
VAKVLLTSEDVRAAARFIAGKVVRTPVLRSTALSAIAGVELWLKAENLQRIGAFKARGAMYAIGRLGAAERARGVITYSSGNHAQAVALAAREHGATAQVVMPEDAPAIKVAAVRALGASVSFAGTTSDHRKAAAERLSEESGAVIIPPFDDPRIIAGQGTATLELMEQVAAEGAALDALLVPVGGGGLVAGACLAASAAETPIAVYSVEPHGADAMARSIEAGERVAVEPGPTLADGLKPVRVGELNFAIAREHLAGCLRVGDEAIGRAITALLIHARVLVEPSGAAALAAALGAYVPGKPRHVGVILSGGNLGPEALLELLTRFPPHPLA